MPELLAAAGILVATAGATSLLLALPAVGLSETAGPSHAAHRARIWLAALVLPPLIGLIAAAAALGLYAEGLVASPHMGGQRPHLCLLGIYQAPAGAYRLNAFAWLCLILVALALARLIIGAATSHLLKRLVLSGGAPLPDAAPGCVVHEVRLSRPTSFSAGLFRPVIVLSTPLLQSLDAACVNAIIAHERAHCRRRDTLMSLLADASLTLLVLLPTAHYYRRQWLAASETAADDAALAAGVSPDDLRAALQALRGDAPRTVATPTLFSLLIPDLPVTDQRLARLADAPDEQPARTSDTRALFWAALALAVLTAALLLLTSSRSVQDTLFCAAEQLTRAAQ